MDDIEIKLSKDEMLNILYDIAFEAWRVAERVGPDTPGNKRVGIINTTWRMYNRALRYEAMVTRDNRDKHMCESARVAVDRVRDAVDHARRFSAKGKKCSRMAR